MTNVFFNAGVSPARRASSTSSGVTPIMAATKDPTLDPEMEVVLMEATQDAEVMDAKPSSSTQEKG